MKLAVSGQLSFGRAVLSAILGEGLDEVASVFAPADDPLSDLAAQKGVPVYLSSSLCPEIVEGCDLLVAAHSHAFVGRKTRARLRLGAIGYHPSLLPRHRGRDAVRWTIRMKDPVAGGSVYWLNETVDGGPIAAQDYCFVRPGDDASELWRRDLFPMGVRLLIKALSDVRRGDLVQIPQDSEVATWEPSISGAPRLYRPELEMIGALPDGYRVVRDRQWA